MYARACMRAFRSLCRSNLDALYAFLLVAYDELMFIVLVALGIRFSIERFNYSMIHAIIKSNLFRNFARNFKITPFTR